MSEYHTSVLLDESVSALVGSADGVYADATFGGGGHTAEILSRLSLNGSVLAFDEYDLAARLMVQKEPQNAYPIIFPPQLFP